jgi:DNA-binding transcriptional LysR family regulator
MPALKDLNKLNTFVRVAERCSFTKAAHDLRVTPSVISKHISELEDTLGFSLLNRSTHGVALTEIGESFLANCLQMLGMLDTFVTSTRNIQAGPCGTLRVHATTGYARWILAPLMSAFVRRYPQIAVELSTGTLIQSQTEDDYDVILASKKPAVVGLISREIGSIQHAICASPEYFRAHGKPKKPQDLRQHNCLVNSLFAPKEWIFKSGSREIVVEVKGRYCSNSSAVLIQAALDGIGIVRVPRYTVRTELATGQLEAIFESITCSRGGIRAYYSKTKYLPAKTMAFVEFLQSAIAEREA